MRLLVWNAAHQTFDLSNNRKQNQTMNTKQLMVAAGLMFLTTACQKDDDPIRPAYVAPSIGSPAQVVDEIDSDSVYTTDGKGKPVKLRQTSGIPAPKSDVMPTDL